MNIETIRLPARDGLMLEVLCLEPRQAKGAVQIIHGAKEHKERYLPFAHALCDAGFVVIISDLRGHGASVNGDYPLGYMHGIDELIDDQRLVSGEMAIRYDGLPLHLFGHSFGTCIARGLLEQDDARYSSLIMSGTVNYRAIARLGMLIGRAVRAISGDRKRSWIMGKLNFEDDTSWVVGEPGAMAAYLADPLCCGYKYSNGAIMTIWQSVTHLKRLERYACHRPKLPILMISGDEDPITGGEKGLDDTVATLRRIGYEQIEKRIYAGMKHEVLNEAEKIKVFSDCIAFYEGVCRA